MLEKYGFNNHYKEQITTEEFQTKNLIIGRIVTDYGNGFIITNGEKTFTGTISGKFRHDSLLYPVIGDFILGHQVDDSSLVIDRVLERKTAFKRKIAGNEFKEQVQGANFDYAFIVSSMNKDLNLRKIERYIVTAWDTGATPVIILTKADLAESIEETREEVSAIALGVDIHCISSLYQLNLDGLSQYMTPGTTIALFGSSGVGKSTLINTLAGESLMKVKEIREDDARGRHTTTHRELIMLPNGTLFMDTPGMREIAVWDDGSGIDQTFQDVKDLEIACKFRNCTHKSEPGCQILSAIKNGDLEEKRYLAYIKLQKEAAYILRKAARKERKYKS